MDLQAIEARLAAATPGPWDFDTIPETGESRVVVRSNTGDSMLDVSVATHGVRAEDSEFIAHAPEDIRALLDAVKEVKALHRPYLDSSSVVETCGNCLQRYPCTTIRALGVEE